MYYLAVSVVQKWRNGLAGWDQLRIFHEAEIKMSAKGLTGPGGSTSKMTHSHGCVQEASAPSRLGLSRGCLHTFTTGLLAFLRVTDLRDTEMESGERRSCEDFYDLSHSHTCHIVFIWRGELGFTF